MKKYLMVGIVASLIISVGIAFTIPPEVHASKASNHRITTEYCLEHYSNYKIKNVNECSKILNHMKKKTVYIECIKSETYGKKNSMSMYGYTTKGYYIHYNAKHKARTIVYTYVIYTKANGVVAKVNSNIIK